MKAPTRKGAVLPRRRTATAASSKLSKTTPERQIVEHLQTILAKVDAMPVLTGELGCQALDCFELVDKIRTRYREKARKLLLEQPGMIPCWHAVETSQRVLSKNTLKVFIAAAHADNGLTAEEFLTACTTSLSSLRKLLAERNPDWTADEIEHVLNRALSDLISYDTITRLSRSKGKQLELSL